MMNRIFGGTLLSPLGQDLMRGCDFNENHVLNAAALA
jgi:hypothetical protein